MEPEMDIIAALHYDICEAAENCKPCVHVRDRAVEEIKSLRSKLDEQQKNWERDLEKARREFDRAGEAEVSGLRREINSLSSRLDAIDKWRRKGAGDDMGPRRDDELKALLLPVVERPDQNG